MDRFAISISSAEPIATPVSQRVHTRDDLKSNLAHQKRDTIRVQPNSRPELKVISQPFGVNLNDLPGYIYEETASEVTMFVMDFGINQNHPVSTLFKD
jgi:hypothetical protein